ncbi:DUF3060 domain-containing protein [Mycobacteroides abscessus subsp. abscessus]|nr:DUF3060 domain-containing protein [Mycobacteroides abscessus subsp. abscessus]
MEPDGDPEARIRELERPLSERAQRSELGAPSQSPYPLPAYDMTQTSRSPVRTFRRRFLVFLTVITAGAAGLIFYAAEPTIRQGGPTVSGPSGTRPARSTVVKIPRATPSATAAPGPTFVPAGSTFSVAGTHKNVAINCDGCSVSVSGVSNTVEILGNCDTLTVSGVENAVTVETAVKIGVSGIDNQVTYRTGEPQVAKSGNNNTVEQS